MAERSSSGSGAVISLNAEGIRYRASDNNRPKGTPNFVGPADGARANTDDVSYLDYVTDPDRDGGTGSVLMVDNVSGARTPPVRERGAGRRPELPRAVGDHRDSAPARAHRRSGRAESRCAPPPAVQGFEGREGQIQVRPDRQRRDKVLGGQPISFRSTEAQLAEEGGTLSASGDLTMAGDTHPVSAQLSVAPDGRVTGTIPLTQSDWGIKPFKAMMGALKVKDQVDVVIDARLPTA